ncbi:hypothetical protein BD410DRAFT_514690 [Rickenella mellea]|uniref:C2H2-type domain-containing protein n=1 Tax=Rickenella mellea TaxID=50990 RepID=A0A4Y7PS28_9AGAM|nr:hypothetical protein BD410DRAFT_514690 [Rickenella mellea]
MSFLSAAPSFAELEHDIVIPSEEPEFTGFELDYSSYMMDPFDIPKGTFPADTPTYSDDARPPAWDDFDVVFSSPQIFVPTIDVVKFQKFAAPYRRYFKAMKAAERKPDMLALIRYFDLLQRKLPLDKLEEVIELDLVGCLSFLPPSPAAPAASSPLSSPGCEQAEPVPPSVTPFPGSTSRSKPAKSAPPSALTFSASFSPSKLAMPVRPTTLKSHSSFAPLDLDIAQLSLDNTIPKTLDIPTCVAPWQLFSGVEPPVSQVEQTDVSPQPTNYIPKINGLCFPLADIAEEEDGGEDEMFSSFYEAADENGSLYTSEYVNPQDTLGEQLVAFVEDDAVSDAGTGMADVQETFNDADEEGGREVEDALTDIQEDHNDTDYVPTRVLKPLPTPQPTRNASMSKPVPKCKASKKKAALAKPQKPSSTKRNNKAKKALRTSRTQPATSMDADDKENDDSEPGPRRPRPFKCTTCGKGSYTSSEAKKHQRTHMDKDWWCAQCRTKYTRQDSLRRHLRNIKNPQCVLHGQSKKWDANMSNFKLPKVLKQTGNKTVEPED